MREKGRVLANDAVVHYQLSRKYPSTRGQFSSFHFANASLCALFFKLHVYNTYRYPVRKENFKGNDAKKRQKKRQKKIDRSILLLRYSFVFGAGYVVSQYTAAAAAEVAYFSRFQLSTILNNDAFVYILSFCR